MVFHGYPPLYFEERAIAARRTTSAAQSRPKPRMSQAPIATSEHFLTDYLHTATSFFDASGKRSENSTERRFASTRH
jgi:hypothetical protein